MLMSEFVIRMAEKLQSDGLFDGWRVVRHKYWVNQRGTQYLEVWLQVQKELIIIKLRRNPDEAIRVVEARMHTAEVASRMLRKVDPDEQSESSRPSGDV